MNSGTQSRFEFPQSRCRAGVARRDITPPVGIYHRMWGAATHNRATGVHRPLLATALVLEPVQDGARERQVIVAIDHCLMWAEDMDRLRRSVCEATGVAGESLQIAFSHTHAAGLMDGSRSDLPGGELIGPYLEDLAERMADAVSEAIGGLQPASIVYGVGRCDLAAHRDYWDADFGQFACGFNPAGPADDTVLIGRISYHSGRTVAVVVNYACHPTTLAWDNTEISPDYIGATRELIEEATGGCCVFLQGASGDLGPRDGYVGDPSIADRNGRQLGFAVLSALESMPKAGVSFDYAGPVVSGATIGTWQYRPVSVDQQNQAAVWRRRQWNVALPYRADLPTLQQTEAELARWSRAEREALAGEHRIAARDCHAQVERMNRQLTRLRQLPQGVTFPLPVTCWQLGDAIWIMLEGEYYNLLQRELRQRFPSLSIFVATVVNGWRPAYLPTRETYGRGIYQEQVAVLAPGCLEAVIEAIWAQLTNWQHTDAPAAQTTGH